VNRAVTSTYNYAHLLDGPTVIRSPADRMFGA
jgi:hypothetical protein